MSNAARRMVTAPVREADFRAAVDEFSGWCRSCADFTADGVEPDARRYVCPQCNNETVYGAEEALMRGMVTIVAD